MHDIWNPWHGCVKYSEGCMNCYMYVLDKMRNQDGSHIYKTNDFAYPLSRNRDGTYKIQVNYFGNSSQKYRLQGAPMIKATIYKNYGRANEQSEDIMIRINDKKGTIDIGEYIYKTTKK